MIHNLSYIQFQSAKNGYFPIVISFQVFANPMQELHVLSAAFCMLTTSMLPALCLLSRAPRLMCRDKAASVCAPFSPGLTCDFSRNKQKMPQKLCKSPLQSAMVLESPISTALESIMLITCIINFSISLYSHLQGGGKGDNLHLVITQLNIPEIV